MSNIEIAVRVRPLIEREKKENLEPLWEIKENSIVQSGLSGDPYIFDHIFNENQSNADLYHSVVKPLVLSCLEGINATILAYGQTSSGKTHTVVGTKDNPGVITHAVNEIFNFIDNDCSRDFLLRCSYLEIYNEKVNDLLNVHGMDLKVREDYNQQVYVEKAQEEVIHTPDDFFGLMKRGMKTRKIGCTDMNERSSRSHTILKLVIQSQCKASEGSFTESVLSLVDLAGSERVGQMSMDRSRQVEGVSINKSLTTLALVIRRLSENDTFVNYRDSKLTRLLQHSLGGNSKTLIIATVTVAASEETKSTLEFAQRAKTVKNRPEVNRRVTDKDQLKLYERLCENYKSEIEKLYSEKLEKERTIDALNGKISNIRLFTDLGSNRSGSARNIRRHTMWSHSHDQQNILPLKSTQILAEPVTPPAKLRLEKQLLEVSYEGLKEFTKLERQFTDESLGYLNDYQELLARLREENCNYQTTQKTILTELRDTKDHLLTLKRLLSDQENNAQGFLGTIIEEDFTVFDQENSPKQLEKLFKKYGEAEENVDALQTLVLNKKQIEEFNTKIAALELLLKEKELVIKTNEEEISQKSDQLNLLEDQIDKLSKANLTKDQELAKLRLCLAEQDEEISSLRKTVHSKNEQDSNEDVLQKLVLSHKKQIDKFNNKINSLESLLQQQELVTTINEEVITKKNEEINQLHDQIGKLSEGNLTKDQELTELRVSLSEKIEEISRKNDEINLLQNQISKMNERNLINDQELTKLRFSLSQKNEEISILRETVSNKDEEEISRKNDEINKLQKQISKLNEGNLISDQELAKLRLCISERMEEISSLCTTISNKNEEISNLNEDVARLAKTNQDLKEKAEQLFIATDLQKSFSSKVEEINRLNTIVHTLKDKLEEANKNIITKDRELSKLHLKNEEGDVLERKLAEIEKENAIKEQEVIDLRLDLADKMEKLSDLQKSISNKMEEINRLNATVYTLKDELEKANKVVITKDQELSKLHLKNEEGDVLERKLAEIKIENTIKEQEVANLRLDLSDKKEKLSDLQKLISNKMEEINRLNATVQILNEKLEDANKVILTKEQELLKLHQNRGVGDVLERKLAKIKNENTIKEQEVANLRLALSDTNEKLSDLQKSLSNKIEEIGNLKNKVDLLTGKVAKTNKDRQELEIVQSSLSEKDQEMSRLQQSITKQNEEIRKLKSDKDLLKDKLAKIHSSGLDKDKEITELRQSVVNQNIEIDNLKEKFSGLLTKKLPKNNDQNCNKNRELDNLRKCLADKDREIQRLGRKLSKSDPFKEKYDKNVTALDQSDTEENSPFDNIFDDFNQGGFINENSDLKRELKMTKALHGASETKCRQQSAVIDHLTETNMKMTEAVENLKQELREAKRQRSATPPLSDCLPLSPNQIRKIKRRSIHDQRRGISPGAEEMPNAFIELHKDSTKGRCGNRQPVQLIDKACQIEESVNTDIYRQEYEALCEKYTALQKVARYRRREANHLRLKLNIAPDAPVLPAQD